MTPFELQPAVARNCRCGNREVRKARGQKKSGLVAPQPAKRGVFGYSTPQIDCNALETFALEGTQRPFPISLPVASVMPAAGSLRHLPWAQFMLDVLQRNFR